MDGERLTHEDEKVVVDKLLVHHPHSEDKIGCGLDSIMVSFDMFTTYCKLDYPVVYPLDFFYLLVYFNMWNNFCSLDLCLVV